VKRAMSIVMAATLPLVTGWAATIATAADAWSHALAQPAQPPQWGELYSSPELPLRSPQGSPVRPGDHDGALMGNIPGRPGTVPGLPETAPGATDGGLGRVPTPSAPPSDSIGLPSEDSR